MSESERERERGKYVTILERCLHHFPPKPKVKEVLFPKRIQSFLAPTVQTLGLKHIPRVPTILPFIEGNFDTQIIYYFHLEMLSKIYQKLRLEHEIMGSEVFTYNSWLVIPNLI